MGLFSWLIPSKATIATKIIEQSLEKMKASGLFDLDPKQSAHQVKQFSCDRLQGNRKIDLHPSVLAASWLTIFVLEFQSSREARMPFANVALGLVGFALNKTDAGIGPADKSIAERAFEELSTKFFNDKSINLDLSTPTTQSEIVVQLPPFSSSMLCIVAEHNYLNKLFGDNGAWKLISQTSMQQSERFYDKFDIEVKNQEMTSIWFDITESRRQWTVEENVAALSHFAEAAQKTH